MSMVLFLSVVFCNLFVILSWAQSTKKVFVHYLPWFDASGEKYPARTGWCYPYFGAYNCSDPSVIHYSNVPLIGEYSQFDNYVLEYHFLLIFVTGIDGIVININPANPLQKDLVLFTLDKLLEMKSSFPSFDLNIIVSYDDGSSLTDQSLITIYLKWIYDNIYNNPKYSSLVFNDDANRPVLFFWSESDNEHYWNTVQSLFQGNVLVFIRNAVNFQYSDGNFEWVNNLNTGKPLSNTANWGQQYFEDMDWSMARQSENGVEANNVNALKVGGVYPGFDDQNVPSFWNGGTNRYHLRNVDDGETMALTWQKQIDYTTNRLGGSDSVQNPWIQITTWNDWPEGTSIEPSTMGGYGYVALETNRQKIAEFKSTSPSYKSACLRVPFEVYTTRKTSSSNSADETVKQLLSGNCMLQSPSPSLSITGTVSPSTTAKASTSPPTSVSPFFSPTLSASTSPSSLAFPSASPLNGPLSTSSPSPLITLSPSMHSSPFNNPPIARVSPISQSPSPSFFLPSKISPSPSASQYPSPSASASPKRSSSPLLSSSPSPPQSVSPSSSPKCPCPCIMMNIPFNSLQFIRNCRIRNIFSSTFEADPLLSEHDILIRCKQELFQCGAQPENEQEVSNAVEDLVNIGNDVFQSFFS